MQHSNGTEINVDSFLNLTTGCGWGYEFAICLAASETRIHSRVP